MLICFSRHRVGHTIKTKLITFQIVDPEIKLSFDLCKIFQEKTIFILDSINGPNSIAWLLLLPVIFGNMCIAIICCPGCGVMNFEINHGFQAAFLHNQKTR